MAKVKFTEKEFFDLRYTLELIEGEGEINGSIELNIPDDQVEEVKDALEFCRLLNKRSIEIDNACGGYETGEIQSLKFELSIWRKMRIHNLSWKEGIELLNK